MSSPEENAPESRDSSSENHTGTKISTSNVDVIQEIRHLTSQTRLWRIGSVVVVLLIFSLFTLSIYNHIRGEFPKDTEEVQAFADNIREQANVSLVPRAQKMFKETLMDSREEISTQLRLLWEDRGGEVLSIAAEELDTLVRGVPSRAIESYDKVINQALAERMDGLSHSKTFTGNRILS